jgi:hypothetical protein
MLDAKEEEDGKEEEDEDSFPEKTRMSTAQ